MNCYCIYVMQSIPWIVVSVKEGRSKQKVAILREGAHFGRHLTLVPHCWTKVIILIPWV